MLGVVAALVPGTRPNHRYPNRHLEEDEVTKEEEDDDVKEENGGPLAENQWCEQILRDESLVSKMTHRQSKVAEDVTVEWPFTKK